MFSVNVWHVKNPWVDITLFYSKLSLILHFTPWTIEMHDWPPSYNSITLNSLPSILVLSIMDWSIK